MAWVINDKGKKVWQPNEGFDANKKIETPAAPFKSQMENQTQAVINQQNRTDDQKNADIINNAHGVQSQNIRQGFENAPVAQAQAAPVVSAEEQAKQAELAERMKDPEYAKLHAVDPVEADKAYNTMRAEHLDEIIKANAAARETPEEQEARLKRERRDRNLNAAFNMIGALGNFVGAASQSDGRSVPVADIPAAIEKKQTAAQAQREAALGKLREAERRKSDIIENGYRNADARKKLDADIKYKEETLKRQQEKDAQDLELKRANLEIAHMKAKNAQDNAEASQKTKDALAKAQMGYYSARSQYLKNGGAKSGGGTGSNKVREFLASGGEEVIRIPENRFKSAVYGAFSKLSPEDQEKAAEMIFKDIAERNGREAATEARNNYKRRSAADKKHWITMHAEEMHAVLEAMADEPGAKTAIDYLRNASQATEGEKQVNDGLINITGFGDDDDEENDGLTAIEGF